ncbi:ankyrin repeat and LEM domain-containing protein 2 [Nephila pilipes]|uniref:Ankyrin repeat and LEM domain-containing protein 2 n=1 Tax=Nephila pilipes TaxID=299642 RepID=A0A8X6UFN1_NEPPI|nr:ankyrin repeat and LEM domain-containing protein 2 [Nephila pilipes]
MANIKPEHSETNQKKPSKKLFYGVSLLQPYEPSSNDPLVFTEFSEVRKYVRAFKGARFCSFENLDEAIQYASPYVPLYKSTRKPKTVVKPPRSSFQLIKKYLPTIHEDGDSHLLGDLHALHNIIRSGNEVTFNEFVWKHPNTLFDLRGIPHIVVDNNHFNALQAAARFNYPLICQLILDILEQPKFAGLLFPVTSFDFYSQTMRDITEMYLNSGSRNTGDTPLHYATKYGFIDCCKVLLSHPLCEASIKNHGGFTPEDIICTCENQHANILKEDLHSLFTEDRLYVPVFRSDRGFPPVIGKPFKFKDLSTSKFFVGNDSLYKLENIENYSLKAFAGPMSAPMAQLFYKGLKNPSSPDHSLFTPHEKSIISKIKFSDPEKGLERIGRSLAKVLNIEWKEYFSVFNSFTNLTDQVGLKILEDYLKKRQDCYLFCGPLPSYNSKPLKKCLALVQHYPPHVNPLCHKVNKLLIQYKEFITVTININEDENEGEEEFMTPPLSPYPEFSTPPKYFLSSPVLSSSTVFLKGSFYGKEFLKSYELNPLKPLPVPKPYAFDQDSSPRKRLLF